MNDPHAKAVLRQIENLKQSFAQEHRLERPTFDEAWPFIERQIQEDLEQSYAFLPLVHLQTLSNTMIPITEQLMRALWEGVGQDRNEDEAVAFIRHEEKRLMREMTPSQRQAMERVNLTALVYAASATQHVSLFAREGAKQTLLQHMWEYVQPKMEEAGWGEEKTQPLQAEHRLLVEKASQLQDPSRIEALLDSDAPLTMQLIQTTPPMKMKF